MRAGIAATVVLGLLVAAYLVYKQRREDVPREPQPQAPQVAVVDANELTTYVSAHEEDVLRCEAGAEEDVIGVVEISLSVGADGNVGGRVVRSDIENQEVEKCALAAVRRWQVDDLHGPRTITYPFHFQGIDVRPELARGPRVEIARVIRAQSPDIDRCVAAAGERLDGDVELDLSIDESGVVTDARARPTNTCLAKAARAWKFAALPSAVEVAYAFVVNRLQAKPPLRWSETAAIARAIARHSDDIDACADRHEGVGTVYVRLGIDARGAVSAVVDKSTVESAALDACVLKAVKSWHFAARSAPVALTYAFQFDD
jgi:hypothetical protein